MAGQVEVEHPPARVEGTQLVQGRPPQPAVVGQPVQQYERGALVVLAETVAGQSGEHR